MPWAPPSSDLLTQSNTAAAVLMQGWVPPDQPLAPVPGDLSPANTILRQGAPARSTAYDYLSQIVHGLGRGAAAIPGLAGDIPAMAGRGAEWLGSKIAPETTAGIAETVRPIASLLTPPTSAETVGFA